MAKFDNFTFEHLSKLQVGKIREYWAKIWMFIPKVWKLEEKLRQTRKQ